MGKQYKALVLGFLFFCSVILPSFSFQKETQAVEVVYTAPFSPWITIKNLVWTGLGNGDTGKAFVGLGGWDTATVQVTGTFAGATCTIEASNDIGTPTWYTAKDITTAGVYVINAGYYQVRPKISAGAGATLTITLVATESTPDTKNLDDLLDVVISNPANTQVIKYNSTTSKWENSAAGGAGAAGGSDTCVQFNNSGTLDGNVGFTYNKSITVPTITLTDTDASSADLQIDVDANIAQIRAVGGAANSLITLNLDKNSIGIGNVPGTIGELLNLRKISALSTDVPMTINGAVEYTGTITLGHMYGMLQNVKKSGAGDVTNMLGINCYATGITGGGTISNLAVFNSDISVLTGTTITDAKHYHVTPATGTGTVTNQVGYICPLLTKGTNRAGFVYGLADGTSPTGVYAIYANTDPSFFGASVDINNTNPTFTLTDTTASARSLKLKVDGDKAYLQELAGVDGSLLILDLFNNRIGINATPNRTFKLGTGNTKISGVDGVNGFEVMALTNGGILLGGDFAHPIIQGISSDGVSAKEILINREGGNVGIGVIGSEAINNLLTIVGAVSIGSNYNVAAPTNGLIVEGKVGIGTIAPTAVLHLKAGTATANTAPLKFTSGPLISPTPEPGAIEFLTDAFYGTITTGAARKTFAFAESLTDGSVSALFDELRFDRVRPITGTDLNVLTTSGFYDGNTLTNAPGASTGWFYIEHLQHSNASDPAWRQQIAYGLGSPNSGFSAAGTMYIRTMVNNVWQAWRTVTTT